MKKFALLYCVVLLCFGIVPAHCSGEQVFAITGTASPSLLTIDTATGNGSLVGPSGIANPTSIEYVSTRDTIYAVDGADGVYTIDRASGQSTFVGMTGVGTIDSIAFIPTTGELVGVDNEFNRLVTIDLDTGAATAISPVDSLGSGSDVRGLAFDTSENSLLALTISAGAPSVILATIDLQNGTATNFRPTGLANAFSLAYDQTNDVLYSVNSPSGSELFTITRSSGSGSSVGSVGFNDISGLTFAPSAVPEPNMSLLSLLVLTGLTLKRRAR